jgi:hypothetical protein
MLMIRKMPWYELFLEGQNKLPFEGIESKRGIGVAKDYCRPQISLEMLNLWEIASLTV